MKKQFLLALLVLTFFFSPIATIHAKTLTDLKTFNIESVGAGPDGPGGDIFYSLRAYNNGGHDLIYDLPSNERNTDTQTLSAYFKDTGSRWVYLATRASGHISRTYFDLVAGGVGITADTHQAEIIPQGGGWYLARIRYSGTNVTSVHFGVAQGNNHPFFYANPGTDRVFFSEPTLISGSSDSTTTRSSPTVTANNQQKALWVWTANPVLNVSERTDLLTFVLNNELNRVYIDARTPVLHNQYMLAEFIRTFHSRGVAVELMFGKPEWALYYFHHELLDLIDQSVEFVHRYPDARPDGIHLDIEAHLVDQWQGDRNGVANQLLDLLANVQRRLDRVSLALYADIPVWWDTFSIVRDGYPRPFHHWMIDATDGVALMDYRDTEERIINDADAELRYASSRGKPVVVGVETMCIEPTWITFCQEGNRHMRYILRRVDQRLRGGHSSYHGFAVHHYHSYLRLRQ